MKNVGNEALEGFSIKPMEVKDLGEVASVAASSSLTAWTETMFAEEIKNSFSHCFVGKVNGIPTGRVVGFICFRTIQDESDLLNLCVHPRFRRRSIGRRLMQFYMDFCNNQNIKTFYIEVHPSNEFALRLYRSFFYKPSGIRKNFYEGKSDALFMVKREA